MNSFEAAKVQGFTWEQDTYEFRRESKEGARCGESIIVQPIIDERTYLILVQRYKELFSGGAPDSAPDAPYELDGHITEIDTGLIDSDYMNSNFEKWLKCLEQDDEDLAAAREELHRSFASLSQDDQRFAELFLHDVGARRRNPQRGHDAERLRYVICPQSQECSDPTRHRSARYRWRPSRHHGRT